MFIRLIYQGVSYNNNNSNQAININRMPRSSEINVTYYATPNKVSIIPNNPLPELRVSNDERTATVKWFSPVDTAYGLSINGTTSDMVIDIAVDFARSKLDNKPITLEYTYSQVAGGTVKYEVYTNTGVKVTEGVLYEG